MKWIMNTAVWFAAGFSLATTANELPAASVVVSQAQQQWMQATLDVPATVVSRNDAVLAAEQAGRLNAVVDIGERVIAGEVVAQVDDAMLQLELQESQAQIARLQARETYLQRRLHRLTTMAERQSSSKQEVELAESEWHEAQQQLVEAQVVQAKINHRLNRSAVLAPFSGIVVERMQQAGEYAAVGAPLVRLVSVENLEVKVHVPLRLRSYLRTEDLVDVQLGERTLALPVRTLIPVGDQRSRTMEVRLRVPESEGLSVGDALTVAIPAEVGRSALAIDRDALVLRESDKFVFVIDEQQRAQKVPVTLGSGDGVLLEVSGELQAGDAVVIRGAERLQAGQKVIWVEDPS